MDKNMFISIADLPVSSLYRNEKDERNAKISVGNTQIYALELNLVCVIIRSNPANARHVSGRGRI